MSSNGKNFLQAVNCCPDSCPVDQVVCLNCCVPISATCNGMSTQTLFSSVSLCRKIDGFIEINNQTCPATLPGCTLVVQVRERRRTFVVNVAAGSDDGIFVNDVLSVSVGAIGPVTTDFARGEANIQFRKIIRLDC